MQKNFCYPKFSDTPKCFPTNCCVLWENKVFKENCDIPLLGIKFFDTSKFLKHRRDAHENFWHCETKNHRRKNVIPPFWCKNFFETKNFLKKSRIPFGKFSVLWDKRFRIKPWCPSPTYAWKLSIKEFFWNTKVFSNEIIYYSETKTSTENHDTPPLLSINNFPYKKFSETKSGSLARFSRSCEMKKFRTKPWSFPPPLPETLR